MSHMEFDTSTGDMDSKSFTRTLLDVLQQAPASDSRETQSVLVPRLLQLDVAEENPWVGNNTVSVLLDMIESRNARRMDLGKELCINLDFGGLHVLTADLTTRLKELEAKGVKCHLE
ncbi:hypothetical protein VNI00_003309 [Paramarasmius palmivorus]|uniref:Uncharacterized protein n=1 Tax=Paramarasmius palmivorus TaxID=297713 RepID=A0AAW0DUQ9_9AGAR